jgi:hypothetical protein
MVHSHISTCADSKTRQPMVSSRTTRRGNERYSSLPRVLLSPPTLRSIAEVKVHHTSIECIDGIVITQPRIQHISFSCPWRTQYEHLLSHLRRIIGPCPLPPQLFQTLPSSTNIRSARNGSVLQSLGYQGWLIATFDNYILLEGVGATDGRVKNTQSYRAELCGKISTFSILNFIRRVYGFTPTSVEHVCDNQSDIPTT